MSGETMEENILPFSYAVARPMSRHSQCQKHHHYLAELIRQWHIYEKGSDQSRPPYEISYWKIRSAQFPIRDHIIKMKLSESSLGRNKGFRIYLKKDQNLDNMDSVKARGVIYTLRQLSKDQKRKGVITISTGTFAGILCYYGKKFDVPVTVVLPTTTADENIRMCRDSPATVMVHGINMIEAHNKAVDIAMKEGLFYIDRNDHPDMIVGQATLGIEIFEQQKIKLKPEDEELLIDAVILPTAVRDCGLTMAIALTIKELWNSNISVYEVLPEVPDPLVEAVRTRTVLFDELRCITAEKYIGYIDSTCLVKKFFNDSITVSEIEVRHAVEHLREVENVVDSNAAIGLAAILSGKLNMLKGKRVILPLFGRLDSSTELTE